MRIASTMAVGATYAAILAWQFTHGGVPSHHLLAQEALPSMSNWWGLLTLPALTWFLLGRIARRRKAGAEAVITTGFGAALLFGAVLSLLFATGQHQLTGYMPPALGVIALCYPLYRAECFLGFVIGMTWVFGPVIPILAGAVFALAGALLYHLPRLIGAAVAGRIWPGQES